MIVPPRRVDLLRHFLPALFALVGLGLLPWTLWLSIDLPARHLVRHWDLAWAGFDVMLMASLLATSVAAVRRSPRAGAAAAASGALLVADAWFDVLTSGRGDDTAVALGFALGAELPLACLCLWLVLDPGRFYAAGERLRGTSGRHALPFEE